MLSAEIRQALHDLGVTPQADPTEIRRAWRALVRDYHPDQVRGDKVEANRRLARLNAAFDLLSTWSPNESAPPQRPSRPAQPPRPTSRGPGQPARRARAEQDAAARRRAAALDADETKRRAEAAARRAARAGRSTPEATPETLTKQTLFLSTLRAILPKVRQRTLARV